MRCVVETTGGERKEIRRGDYPATHRGGKGYEIVKRADLAARDCPADRIGRLGTGRGRQVGRAKRARPEERGWAGAV